MIENSKIKLWAAERAQAVALGPRALRNLDIADSVDNYIVYDNDEQFAEACCYVFDYYNSNSRGSIADIAYALGKTIATWEESHEGEIVWGRLDYRKDELNIAEDVYNLVVYMESNGD